MARRLNAFEEEVFLLALRAESEVANARQEAPARPHQEEWATVVDTQEWPQFITPPELPAKR